MESKTLDNFGTPSPVLSIVILTFNHEKFIGECLNRIQGIRGIDLEVIVLDDGSTDGTSKVVEKYQRIMPELKLITQQNTGNISANTKRLLELAAGKYITFLSGDDMLGSDFPVSSILESFAGDPNCLVIFTPGKLLGTKSGRGINSKRLGKALSTGRPSTVLNKHLYKRVSRIFLQGTTIRRELLDLAGLPSFNELDDDYDFVFRIFRALDVHEKTFHYFTSTYWEYRVHNGNLHKNGLRQLESTLRVIKKYVPLRKSVFFKYDVPQVTSRSELNQALEILTRYTRHTARLYLSLVLIIYYQYGKVKRHFRK